MRIREYTANDLHALRQMHASQGFGYPFPDLESAMFVSKLVLEEDGAEKLRKRAGIYDPLTVAYFTALGVEIPRVTGVSLFGGSPDN